MAKSALRLCRTPATTIPVLDCVNPRSVDMAYVLTYKEVLCVYAHITAKKVSLHSMVVSVATATSVVEAIKE